MEPFGHFTHFPPPIEIVAIEVLYFIVVVSLCLIIYRKTKEVYTLSKHQGIYHFRNIFLYFAIAYSFRLLSAILLLSDQLLDFEPPWFVHGFSLFFVGYFSTLAILSLVLTLTTHISALSNKSTKYLLHAIAFLSSIAVFVTRSGRILIFLQTLVFLIALLACMIGARKKASNKFLSSNRVTYLILFIFWIMNTWLLTNRFAPVVIKIPLYILSIAVFMYLFMRVQKRIHNG